MEKRIYFVQCTRACTFTLLTAIRTKNYPPLKIIAVLRATSALDHADSCRWKNEKYIAFASSTWCVRLSRQL